MRLYTAFDLHSNNSYLGILDENGKRAFKRRLPNDPAVIIETLKPFKADIIGIAVESTCNWYWLVDLLMAEGHKVHLANPAEIRKYTGLKYADDQHDAFWLAEMLRLGILPEGYIFPKEDRPIRDLLRKRGHLVRLRTSLILSLRNIISRNNGVQLKAGDIKRLSTDHVAPFLERNEDLAMAGKVSKESIDFFTRQIKAIETMVERKQDLRDPYDRLLTEPGIGKILGLTIMLETGPISRFVKVGNYVSYCRRFRPSGSATRKRKARETRRAATGTLPGPFRKLRDSLVYMTRTHEPTLTARRSTRIAWWRTMPWLTSWREPPITSCEMVFHLCLRNVLVDGWSGRGTCESVG